MKDKENISASKRQTVHHSFDKNIATELGSVELAILLHHITYWVEFNRHLEQNFHEGQYWMYQTIEQMAAHFPYFSQDKIWRLLKKLVDLELISKSNFHKNSFDRTSWYTVNNDSAKPISQIREMDSTDSQNENRDSASRDLGHYIKDSKEEDSKEEDTSRASCAPSDHSIGLVDFFFSKIKSLDPKAKPPNKQAWAKDIDLMHRVDGRSYEEIKRLIEFAQSDTFWRGNILSPKKLREKATQLIAKMQSPTSIAAPKDNKTYAQEIVKKHGHAALKKQLEIYAGPSYLEFIAQGSQSPSVCVEYDKPGFKEKTEAILSKWRLSPGTA